VLPLPDPRPGVAGLLHRDGHTVTVVSPLGGGQAGQVLGLDDGATSIGLLVDEVVGIERVQEEPGRPPPASGRRWSPACSQGLGRCCCSTSAP
jgi:chemotaxis signal transduction protein